MRHEAMKCEHQCLSPTILHESRGWWSRYAWRLAALSSACDAAGNFTWELVAWNATDGPAANSTTPFSVARLGSQQVLTQDMQQLLRENQLDPATLPNYFLHLYVHARKPWLPVTVRGARLRHACAGFPATLCTLWELRVCSRLRCWWHVALQCPGAHVSCRRV